MGENGPERGGSPGPNYFGDGSDGDCVISQDTTLQAKVYNFRNLTICDGVRVRFCGEGVPVIRATGTIQNDGEISLYNPLIASEVCYEIQELGVSIKTQCNCMYSEAKALYDCIMATYMCGGKGGLGICYSLCYYGGDGGGAGESGCNGSGCRCCGTGGTSSYSNAGGGGGGAGGNGYKSTSQYEPGAGGQGCYTDFSGQFCYYAGGGGGGLSSGGADYHVASGGAGGGGTGGKSHGDGCNATYYGGGGGGYGGGYGGCYGGAGYQGLVIIKYPTSCGYTITGGQCCYTCNGYKYHCFTSSGTITVS